MSLFIVFGTAIFLASIGLGLFLILRPAQAIEFQKRFYFKINWRMEPVNMAIEIRNTRIMGFMLMGVAIAFSVTALFLN